jgi:heme/copper-type cytochrome/quinol oxidase subunit 3
VSEQKVVRLYPDRSVRKAPVAGTVVATTLIVILQAMMLIGMLSAFLLTRATSGGSWPPPGQPWFPMGETLVNSAALLASGALVFRASRAWQNPEARIGPQLLAAIALGAFFLFFQGVVWAGVVGRGLDLTPSHHGKFFYLILAMHAATVLGGLLFLGFAWWRLQPLRDDVPPHGSLRTGTFLAAQIFWYFAVGMWPVLYVLLYL